MNVKQKPDWQDYNFVLNFNWKINENLFKNRLRFAPQQLHISRLTPRYWQLSWNQILFTCFANYLPSLTEHGLKIMFRFFCITDFSRPDLILLVKPWFINILFSKHSLNTFHCIQTLYKWTRCRLLQLVKRSPSVATHLLQSSILSRLSISIFIIHFVYKIFSIPVILHKSLRATTRHPGS